MTGKEIWVPKSETTVTVINGVVSIREDMTMVSKPVKNQAGFSKDKDE